MITCPANNELVEQQIARIITQYRESPNLLFLIETYLRLLEESIQRVCDLPAKFDLNTAVGDQLTLLGKQLGWPRCHCVCTAQPVFGFECEGVQSDYPISGFCDPQATWLGCGALGYSEICINDDELYRKFLKVRTYQMTAQFDARSVTECIQTFWGESAVILDAHNGRVLIAPGRELTDSERGVLQLYPRVLPVAPSIEIRFYFGTLPVFGFGDGFVGFCADQYAQATELMNEVDELLLNEDNEILTILETITEGNLGQWACETNVHAYDCPTA